MQREAGTPQRRTHAAHRTFSNAFGSAITVAWCAAMRTTSSSWRTPLPTVTLAMLAVLWVI